MTYALCICTLPEDIFNGNIYWYTIHTEVILSAGFASNTLGDRPTEGSSDIDCLSTKDQLSDMLTDLCSRQTFGHLFTKVRNYGAESCSPHGCGVNVYTREHSGASLAVESGPQLYARVAIPLEIASTAINRRPRLICRPLRRTPRVSMLRIRGGCIRVGRF